MIGTYYCLTQSLFLSITSAWSEEDSGSSESLITTALFHAKGSAVVPTIAFAKH